MSGGDDSSSTSKEARPVTRQLREGRRSLSSHPYCPVGRDSDKKRKYYVHPPSEDKKRFAETSYMEYTKKKYDNHRVIWMGSDGEQNSLSAVDIETGDVVHTCKLKNLPSDSKKDADWEAMALGPCDEDGGRCIYIGNIGNNDANKCKDRDCTKGRKYLYIYKFKEPQISDKKKKSEVKVATLKFKFDDKGFKTKRADSEAMFVDTTGDKKGGKKGDIYIIQKFTQRRKLQRLGKISVGNHKDVSYGKEERVEVEEVDAGDNIEDEVWTDADMSEDGRLVALRDQSHIFFFSREKDSSVAEALRKRKCGFRSTTSQGGDSKQYEGVSFIGDDVAEASECTDKKACKVKVTRHRLEFKD